MTKVQNVYYMYDFLELGKCNFENCEELTFLNNIDLEQQRNKNDKNKDLLLEWKIFHNVEVRNVNE